MSNEDGRLAELFETIGKQICHMNAMYINAGQWMVSDIYGKTFKSPTLYGAMRKYHKEHNIEQLLPKKKSGA